MILCDKEIKKYLKEGIIKIKPKPDFKEQLGPCSLDLCLGNTFKTFKPTQYPYLDLKRKTDFESVMEIVEIEDGGPFILQPNEFVIAVAKEDVTLPSDIMGRLDGRSSLGRLGLVVHSTAARFDPGWTGKPVMELGNLGIMPIILYVGMRVCAMTFETLSAPAEKPYLKQKDHKYAGQKSAVASRLHKEERRKKK
ncbi:MAG: dCTP deaminase [Candidatus Pacebacteria bacterium]|nr:dCTP deaminase [Candidatus Paceibacterota bacterium]